MRINLDVPPGTRLLLLAGEWHSQPGKPATEDQLVISVAVYQEAVGGVVLARGHTCARTEPDCGRGWCWEAQVAVHAIRANLAGAR